MPKVGDVTLMDESFDRFLTMAEEGATTVYSVAGVTFRVEALRSITADGTVLHVQKPWTRIDAAYVGALPTAERRLNAGAAVWTAFAQPARVTHARPPTGTGHGARSST